MRTAKSMIQFLAVAIPFLGSPVIAQEGKTYQISVSTSGKFQCQSSFTLYVTSERIFEKFNRVSCGSKSLSETVNQGTIYDVNKTKTENITCSYTTTSSSCSDGRVGNFKNDKPWTSTETKTITSRVSPDEISLTVSSSGSISTGSNWSDSTNNVRIGINGDTCKVLAYSYTGSGSVTSSSCKVVSGRAL
jgi:hypothetical protein